jgi:hypothetical protein
MPKTSEISVAMIRLAPRKTPTPRLMIIQKFGVRPESMKPTLKASTSEMPRTSPLALRVNASCSVIHPPSPFAEAGETPHQRVVNGAVAAA